MPANPASGLPQKPRVGAFSEQPQPRAPASQIPAMPVNPAAGLSPLPPRRSDVPDDVTLLDAKSPAPSSPALPSRMPQGSAPARPAGLDPDTIPPISGRPLGSYPPKSGQGEG